MNQHNFLYMLARLVKYLRMYPMELTILKKKAAGLSGKFNLNDLNTTWDFHFPNRLSSKWGLPLTPIEKVQHIAGLGPIKTTWPALHISLPTWLCLKSVVTGTSQDWREKSNHVKSCGKSVVKHAREGLKRLGLTFWRLLFWKCMQYNVPASL